MLRTSEAEKRILLPRRVANITSLSSWHSSAPIRASFSSMAIARMPARRGREKAASGVFLTTPDSHAKIT